jgi:hypothetical protein
MLVCGMLCCAVLCVCMYWRLCADTEREKRQCHDNITVAMQVRMSNERQASHGCLRCLQGEAERIRPHAGVSMVQVSDAPEKARPRACGEQAC